jgi:hypothetical protein
MPDFLSIQLTVTCQKQNSWTYNFVEVSGHNIHLLVRSLLVPQYSWWKAMPDFLSIQLTVRCQKPNSWTNNFVEVSGHNLDSSHTCGFRIQCLHYKPVSNHFFLKGGGGSKILQKRWLWIARRKTLKTFVPITSKNSASGYYCAVVTTDKYKIRLKL